MVCYLHNYYKTSCGYPSLQRICGFYTVGKFYGPLHYSRHDLVAQTIMRGRDYGLPDYNSVRQAVGLVQRSDWAEINPELNQTNPEVFPYI